MPTNQPQGYLALPASGKGDPVLVLHAWWGLNDTMKAFCDRLAGEGFIAFALDLYHSKVTDQIDEAEKLAKALGEKGDQASADLAEAVTFLKEQAGSKDTGIAVIGFSLGAAYALDLSANMPDAVDSVVLFYGVGPAEFSKAKATYLGHFAEDDPYEPPESMEWLKSELETAGSPLTFHTYPGTGHWFFEPDRADAYNEEAATLAWDRTLDFLKGMSR